MAKIRNQSFSFLTETEKLISTQLFVKMKENLGKNISSLPNEL